MISYEGKLLVLMKGLPRSGKSTVAAEMRDRHGWPVVNPDSFRLAIHGQQYYVPAEPFVWASVYAAVRALFLAGHDCLILDATNMRRSRRDTWRQDGWRVKVYEVQTDKETCIQRAKDEGSDHLIPVIERMVEEHDPLGEDEERLWQ